MWKDNIKMNHIEINCGFNWLRIDGRGGIL
jgi:hypothetical protein